MTGASVGPKCDPPAVSDDHLIYQSVCEVQESGRRPILQNCQRLKLHDDLFYENVMLGGKVTVRAMLDSGSMACTLSSSVVPDLVRQAVLKTPSLEPTDVVVERKQCL